MDLEVLVNEVCRVFLVTVLVVAWFVRYGDLHGFLWVLCGGGMVCIKYTVLKNKIGVQISLANFWRVGTFFFWDARTYFFLRTLLCERKVSRRSLTQPCSATPPPNR